jgi:hypothetical protein
MAATITVRNLGPNYDPLYGNSQANFLTDIDAVAQIIGTKLRFFQGEWWENLLAGTPMFQSILGQGGAGNTSAIAAILQNVIYSVPYVTSISNLTCTYSNRALKFSCTVLTAFGTLQVSN